MNGCRIVPRPGYDAARLYYLASRSAFYEWEWDASERLFGDAVHKGKCMFLGDVVVADPGNMRRLHEYLAACTDPPWQDVEPDIEAFQRHRRMLERMFEASMTAWWRLPVLHHARFANLATYMVTGILGGFGPCSEFEYKWIEHIKVHGLVGSTPDDACRFAETWVYPANPHSIPIREVLHGG